MRTLLFSVLAAVALALVAVATVPGAIDQPAQCAVVDIAAPAPPAAQLEHAPVACICESCTLLSEPSTGRFAGAVQGTLVVRPMALKPSPRRPEVRLVCPRTRWREDR